jgi:hypothetical protein
MAQYWLKRENKTTGPFSGQQLKQMVAADMIVASDMISADQLNWQVAGQVKGLFPAELPAVEDGPVFSQDNWVDQADLGNVHDLRGPLTGQVQNVAEFNAQPRAIPDETPTAPLPRKRLLRPLILVILPILMVCVCMFLYMDWKDRPTVESETPGQKKDEVLSSFTGDSDEVGGEHAAGINAFFDELRHAMAEGDKDKVAELFDYHMMLSLLKQQKMLPASVITNEDEIVGNLSREMANAMVGPGASSLGDRHEIRRVRFIQPNTEAVVYMRILDDAFSGNIKLRWWLYCSGGKWRAYDFEDIDSSIRRSVMVAMGARMRDAKDPAVFAFAALERAGRDLSLGNIKSALATLQGLERMKLPPILDAARLLLVSTALFGLGEYEKSLTAADRAAALNNDMPGVHEIRGDCHNMLKQYAKALNDAERYEKCLGKDAIYFMIVGDAQRGMGRTAEAIRAYKNALADDPLDIAPFLMLLQTLPARQRQSLAKHYKSLGKIDEKFPVMASQLLAERDAAALRTLIDLHKGIRPGDKNIAMFERKLVELRNPS